MSQTGRRKRTNLSSKAEAVLVFSSLGSTGFPCSCLRLSFPSLRPAAQQRILQPRASVHLLDTKNEKEAAESNALFDIRLRITAHSTWSGHGAAPDFNMLHWLLQRKKYKTQTSEMSTRNTKYYPCFSSPTLKCPKSTDGLKDYKTGQIFNV